MINTIVTYSTCEKSASRSIHNCSCLLYTSRGLWVRKIWCQKNWVVSYRSIHTCKALLFRMASHSLFFQDEYLHAETKLQVRIGCSLHNECLSLWWYRNFCHLWQPKCSEVWRFKPIFWLLLILPKPMLSLRISRNNLTKEKDTFSDGSLLLASPV